MPSMKCHECGSVKRCQMYTRERTAEEVHTGGPRTEILYLCKPCARTLGYLTKEGK